MAITYSVLTSGTSATDGTSYNTASISPSASYPVLVFIATRTYGTPNNHSYSVSGCGLTWGGEEAATLYGPTGQYRRVGLIKGSGASPSSGALTLSMTGNTSSLCGWGVIQITGDINTSAPIVQSVTVANDGSSAPYTVTNTLAALSDAVNNAVVAFFCNDNRAATLSPDGSYTELFNTTDGSEDIIVEAQWKLPGATTPNITCDTSWSDIGGIAVELDYSAGGIVVPVAYHQLQQQGIA